MFKSLSKFSNNLFNLIPQLLSVLIFTRPLQNHFWSFQALQILCPFKGWMQIQCAENFFNHICITFCCFPNTHFYVHMLTSTLCFLQDLQEKVSTCLLKQIKVKHPLRASYLFWPEWARKAKRSASCELQKTTSGFRFFTSARCDARVQLCFCKHRGRTQHEVK